MVIASLIISILALICGILSLVLKKKSPFIQETQKVQPPQNLELPKVDLTAEEIVRLLSTLEEINLGKGTIIICDGYYDID